MPALARAGVRRLAVVGFALVATASCLLVLRSRPDDQLADLRVYWGAVRWVEHGLPLYAFKAANGDPFTYPPFAELALAPLGRLPFTAAGVVWTLLSLWAVVAAGRLVAGRALHVPVGERAAASWLIAER